MVEPTIRPRLFLRRRALLMVLLCGILTAALLVVFWPTQRSVVEMPRNEKELRPPPNVAFPEVTDSARIRFRHFNGTRGEKLLPETMGSGVAVLDFDGDGWPDLFFVNSCAWPGDPNPTGGCHPALYRNKGDGTFDDVTEAVGLNGSYFGMGVAVGDIDNDGYPDIFMTAIGGNHLFHNFKGDDGKRHFQEITLASGLGVATAMPEVDRKRFLEWDRPVLFPASATFLDYDGDGKLDLFVCNYLSWSPAQDRAVPALLPGVGRAYVPPQQFDGTHCTLYRNIDGLKFEDVTIAAGIQVWEKRGEKPRAVGKALGVCVCDPDGDGWPDIVVANDTERNFFFHNIPGPNGSRRFEEIGQQTNIAYTDHRARGAMGIDWGEFLPSQWALLITNFADEPNSFLTLEHTSRLSFNDSAKTAGLWESTRMPLKFGVYFFDYDLDGRLDFLSCNGHLEPDIAKVRSNESYPQPAQLFWNRGLPDRLFEMVSAKGSGEDLFRPMVGRGSAYLDYDGDGDLDIVLTENNGPARIFRNENRLGNHWLRLKLMGDGKRSNRDAFGATITLEAGGSIQTRYLAGARGYLSQSEEVVTVGLGTATAVERITVRWPGKDAGAVQEWLNLPVDHEYLLQQGEPKAVRRR